MTEITGLRLKWTQTPILIDGRMLLCTLKRHSWITDAGLSIKTWRTAKHRHDVILSQKRTDRHTYIHAYNRCSHAGGDPFSFIHDCTQQKLNPFDFFVDDPDLLHMIALDTSTAGLNVLSLCGKNNP